MNYNKGRLKIKDKLRKAQTKRDYIACRRYEARLKEIDNLQVQEEKTRRGFGELADIHFTREETSRFTADLIEAIMLTDLLSNSTMKLEEHVLRIPNFLSPDVIKLKKITRDLQSMVAIIDQISRQHPIIDEHGNTYTLSDHYMNMVDEAETKLLGWQNVIHNIVTRTITIDKDE